MKLLTSIVALLPTLVHCTPTIVNCSSREDQQINTAVDEAQGMVQLALNIELGVLSDVSQVPVADMATQTSSPSKIIRGLNTTLDLGSLDSILSHVDHPEEDEYMNLFRPISQWRGFNESQGGLRPNELKKLRSRYFGSTTPEQDKRIRGKHRLSHSHLCH